MCIVPGLYAGNSLKLPPPHQAIYSIEKYGTQIGEMKTRLDNSDGQYIYQSTTSASGFAALFAHDDLVETSTLSRPVNGSDQPINQLSFHSTQGKKNRKNQKITFRQDDPQHVSINGVYKKRTYSIDTTTPVWSRHMLPLLMSSSLQQTPASQQADYSITDRGRLYQYSYTFLKQENLQLPGGLLPVVKFRISRQGSDRFSDVWLSEKHHYLPVKIEQYKDDKLHINLLLTKYRKK